MTLTPTISDECVHIFTGRVWTSKKNLVVYFEALVKDTGIDDCCQLRNQIFRCENAFTRGYIVECVRKTS